MDVVHLRAAVCLLNRFPALAGADLDVGAGQIVLLTGPNGAGKTTLLRLCAGLLPVHSGVATVLGVDLTADPKAVRRSVGLLANGGLYGDLTVTENARFWARAAGLDAAAAITALDAVGVERRLLDVAVARLSTGQRQRVALAGIVTRRPRLWLLDEPHAGLDAAGRDLLDALVVEAARAGATVLVASHEAERVAGFAHRHVSVVGGVTSEVVGAAQAATAPARAASPGEPGSAEPASRRRANVDA